MEPVSQEHVNLCDPFWAPRQRALVDRTIPHLFEQLERAGNVDNFRLAARGAREGYRGPVYMDSDLYKAVEAAALALHLESSPPWKAQLDSMIDLIASAQAEDGYINTYFAINAPEKRYTNLRDAHELYCMGHLIEAAIAHQTAAGDSVLMSVARRVVAHLVDEFLMRARPGYPGHPELELALIRYFEATGEEAALSLAREFLNRRGSHFFAKEHDTPEQEYDGTYWLDRVPIRSLNALEGHAVRALYLMSAATDLARIEGDSEMRHILEGIWKRTTERRMYVTGGFGSSEKNEGFTRDYDLPNRTAYQETCASIAFVFWCERMARLTGEYQYVDAMERTLYNAVAAGASLDGTLFFYDNPLEDDGSRRRQPWFQCACCPPNYARLIAQMGRYVWSRTETGYALVIPIASQAQLSARNLQLRANIESQYPWSGAVRIGFEGDASNEMDLSVRMPGWASMMSVFLNNEEVPGEGNQTLRRHCHAGDEVRIEISMKPKVLVAHPEVEACHGQFCVQRGPVVYCLEGDFRGTFASPDAAIADGPPDPALDRFAPTVTLEARRCDGSHLYTVLDETEKCNLSLIPYALRGNHTPKPTRVWLPTTPNS
jgi:DUF1680 family protein